MADGAPQIERMRAMTEDDLSTVFAWRNHPDVRRHMFARHEIALLEHRQWFERSRVEPGRHLLIYERAGVAHGFVGLHLGRHPQVADWGFYTAPDSPRGTGRAMARCALDHAFVALALHKVCGQTTASNTASIGLHLALGFRQEGALREQHFDGATYQGVVCFGLLAHEWGAGPPG